MAGKRTKQHHRLDYAFQDINDIPGTLPEGRTKPWGTGQAVLAAKKVLNTPFIVINADDYYGKEGFKAVHEYLVNVANALAILEANEHTIYDPPAVFDSNKSEILLSTENKLKEIYEAFPNEGKVVLGYSYLVSWNYVTWDI